MNFNQDNMVLIILIICFFIIGISDAHSGELTKSEINCVARSTYFEARNQSDVVINRVIKTAVNRKHSKHKFGSKSRHLCDIVRSKEYKTNINKPIKDISAFRKIQSIIGTGKYLLAGNMLYFHSDKNGKMFFR